MSNNNMTINFSQGNLADMWGNNSIKEGSLCLAFANNNSAMLYYKSKNNFIPIMPQGANPGQVLCSIDANSAPAYSSAMVLGNGGENSKSGSITLFNSSGQSTSITNEAIG
mgnify:CR=1 FL=1